MLLYKKESYIIQGGAYDVYKKLRNKHKEIVYQKAYTFYLEANGLKVEREKNIPVYYNGKKVGAYIPDIVVNDAIFIELKCKLEITKNDVQQFWHYLKSSDYKLGYLINFGKSDGVQIVRRVYDTTRAK
ncbi:MAG: GxxExxY protein [Patescibacteria group bacterium]|nr:GxxExxY protein [Patescibacteria group bacterium]